MDISPAALPPRVGSFSRADQAHPLFARYREKLSSCARLLIDAPDFRDWLHQEQQAAVSESWVSHPEYPAFLAWCRETQAGGRPCCPTPSLPGGLTFPYNMMHWVEGGRW